MLLTSGLTVSRNSNSKQVEPPYKTTATWLRRTFLSLREGRIGPRLSLLQVFSGAPPFFVPMRVYVCVYMCIEMYNLYININTCICQKKELTATGQFGLTLPLENAGPRGCTTIQRCVCPPHGTPTWQTPIAIGQLSTFGPSDVNSSRDVKGHKNWCNQYKFVYFFARSFFTSGLDDNICQAAKRQKISLEKNHVTEIRKQNNKEHLQRTPTKKTPVNLRFFFTQSSISLLAMLYSNSRRRRFSRLDFMVRLFLTRRINW